MFGKVIELRRNASNAGRGGELPSEISQQFNSEVLEEGLQLAKHSRISHVNFGRESYFGLVTDHDQQAAQVHIDLDPDSKVLKRASCSCFRSSTRAYCRHVVSFIRYVLKPDPETGRLRTLSEDFRDSFWNEISSYGTGNFGDSVLGFKARPNHGGEGLRISFLDRNDKEILAFMPGERLVDEFLHEFYDIIRRDISATLFKSTYARKLKDPSVPSLRRRPWQYSDAEEAQDSGDAKSARRQQNENIWHRIAKVGFLIAGRDGGTFHFRFLEHKQELTAEAFDESEEVILRLTPPRNHIGAVIEAAEEKVAIGDDLLINSRPLQTGYCMDLSESSALRIKPVVENPDPDAEPEDAYLDRTRLEDQHFGKYYFFPDWGFFKISVNINGLPAEYFSAQKAVTIPPEEITPFLVQYGELLKESPTIFMDGCLLDRKTIEQFEQACVEHKAFSDEGVSLDINYDFGDFQLSLRDIFRARKDKKRFLIKGSKWVDTLSSEFAWMDGLDEDAVTDENLLSMGRTDYLRFLATHDERLRKRFSSKRLKEWFNDLESLKPPGRMPAIRAMKGRLRGYQKNGYGWLWFLYENGFSGLLCDDMGLGKTHQIMALMTGIVHRLNSRPAKIRFLVICPTTVLSHWNDKVMEYCPHLDPHVYHGTDRSFDEAFQEHGLIITSYGIALRDVEMLAEHKFDLIVLDEIQAVKNKATKTYAAVEALQSVCTVGLTGTPIENTVRDLKSLFDIVIPGYLFSDSVFEQQFRCPIEEEADKATREKLSRMIHPFTLRRRKEQVLKELPPKIEDVRRCALSEDQMRFYRDVVDNQGRDLVMTLKDPDQKVPYIHIFTVLNYLKQICNHPAMLEQESKDYGKYSSGKWDLFLELLDESLGSGQKVVVFSQYVKMLVLIEAYLKDRGIEFTSIKGSTRKRAEAVRKFNNDPNCMVFSASLRAAGLGIDLTGGSVVIHYDRWWNSAREEQATDRVHRIGQNRGVQVFKLITENTLEEKIDAIISKKRQLMDSIVKEDDQSLLKHFSREDFIDLISL